jgi:hypothetical protein
MTGGQEFTDNGFPIQSSPARFRVNRIGRGQGIVLLYPDKLAAVNSYAELWGIILGSVVLGAISSFLFHDALGVGSVAGGLAGGLIGQCIGKWLAARRAVANRDGVRLIPLDQIASVQFSNTTGFHAWLIGQTLLVTTADGTEHRFRGRLAGWQAALAGALTVSGREVHTAVEGITVMPRVTPEEG